MASDIIIRLHRTGGPAELQAEPLAPEAPGPGEARVRHQAIGVNYVDVYHRTGLYPLPLPGTPGLEACGIVEAVGAGVAGLAPGERVAYAVPTPGSYASVRNVPAARLVALPDELDDAGAAVLLLKGITAHMLLTRALRLRPGDTLLVQAAAGGLGLVLTQWAKALGLRVLGTVSGPEKAALARARGLDHAIDYTREDVAAAVRDLTGGAGADAAIDGIGGATLAATIEAVRPFGQLASIGQAGGAALAGDLSQLAAARQLAVCRPSVVRYMSDIGDYRAGAAAALARAQDGMALDVGTMVPLRAAAEAHVLLESGRAAGSLVLRP
ncbi:MAG: quinone oxidoreductase family protein [Telluria sp.]